MDNVACSADLSWPTAGLPSVKGINDSGSHRPTLVDSGNTMERTGINGPGIIPLRLAHLCRGLTLPDVNGCCFELHSPDGRRSCLLRASDPSEARIWFDALHTRLRALNEQYLVELNGLLPPTQELKHLDWLVELRVSGPIPFTDLTDRSMIQTPSVRDSSSITTMFHTTWKPVFAALSDRDLLLYDVAPTTKEEWANPSQAHPLIATRLIRLADGGDHHTSVNGCELRSVQPPGDMLTFMTRTGSKHGVDIHTFAVSAATDLALWSTAIVNGAHCAVMAAREVVITCRWQQQDCRLTLNYDTGITLSYSARHPMDNYRSVQIGNSVPHVIWHFPYERLRSTADDGRNLLWVDFGLDGEFALDMLGCPKPVVFILHNILSAKVARRGLS